MEKEKAMPDVLAWVEKNGGLDEVRRDFQDAYNRRTELCAALGIDLDTGWSDAMAAMSLRLMPEGMEWLRYDTGEPVPLGGEVEVTVHNEDGDFDRTFAIRSIKYKEDGVLLEGTKNEMVILCHGERVRRPAPKVLAADGKPLEVGQTVWDTSGRRKFKVLCLSSDTNLGEHTVKTVGIDSMALEGWSKPNDLTHERPESWERTKMFCECGAPKAIRDYPTFNFCPMCGRRLAERGE